MSLRGSTLKQYELPVATSIGKAGSRSWRGSYHGPSVLRPVRALAVYDLLPSALANGDYQSWTEEWLPRLVESSEKTLNPWLRSPVGFAISPCRTPAGRRPGELGPSPNRPPAGHPGDLGPVVLHFGGGSSDGRGGRCKKGESTPRKVKPLRRAYTRSVFRRDAGPGRSELFDGERPLSTRKKLEERPSAAAATSGSLPAGYRLPEVGDEGERAADALPEVRRDNYASPDRRKYVVVLTRPLRSSPRLSPTGSSERAVGHVTSRASAVTAAVGAPDRFSGDGPCFRRKGALCHGLACKTNDLQQGHCDPSRPLVVTNGLPRTSSLDTVKVKDALAQSETETKRDQEENKENESDK